MVFEPAKMTKLTFFLVFLHVFDLLAYFFFLINNQQLIFNFIANFFKECLSERRLTAPVHLNLMSTLTQYFSFWDNQIKNGLSNIPSLIKILTNIY